MTHYIMQHFAFSHLPPDLQEVSKKFCDLATELDALLDESPEKEFALRRLLESKDCAVRARNMDIKNAVRDQRIAEVKEQLYPHSGPQPVVNG